MMIRLLALLLCVELALAGQAKAGAWPHEAGTGFASLTRWQAGDSADSYSALFVEYGLLPRLTIGLDAGRSVSGQTKAIAFVRAPFGQTMGGLVAAELGWGEIAGRRVLRPGLSWGRSLARPRWQGWLAVDTLMEVDLETRQIDVKADVTLGLTPQSAAGTASDWTLMIQMQTGLVDLQDSLYLLHTEGTVPEPSFLRLAPSVTYKIRDGMHLELGLYSDLNGSSDQGVKLGLWSRF
ncbi:MAG: hypothetical protein B7X55_01730 [Rhodobacterales bacterium 34-62-10]|nr:MAG: hypothetical protein B7X55_01730 [Rhodobacterales bacterium 34-62-10]